MDDRVRKYPPDTMTKLQLLGAVALGLAIPMIFIGRATLAVVAIPAVIGLLPGLSFPRLFEALRNAVVKPLGIAVSLVFICWAISVAHTTLPPRALEVVPRIMALFFVCVGLVAALRQNINLQDVSLKALVAGALACVMISLICIYVFPAQFADLRGFESDIPSIDLAKLILKSYGTVVACEMSVVFWAGRRLGGVWLFLALIFEVFAVVLLLSLEDRAGLVAASVAGIIYISWFLFNRKRYLIAIFLLGCVILMVGVNLSISTMRNPGVSGALGWPTWLVDAHRQAIWEFSMGHVSDSIVFGIGIGAARRLPGASEYVPNLGQEYIPVHPHNFIVEVLLETGVLGLASLLIALSIFILNLLSYLKKQSDIGVPLLALTFSFWTVNLVSYSIWSYWWQATWLFLMIPMYTAMQPSVDAENKLKGLE